MPAIVRNDGEQFAVYTYRELLALKKSSLLKREIQLLKEEHGQYARFYWQEEGDVEAVFSRDPGFLLAECAWEHFGSPDDLIYCEVMPGEQVAILIVIRAGAVYLDAEVSVDNLYDEFVPLATGENQYDIYIYGDAPLAEVAAEGVFAFDDAHVKSFTHLEDSAFSKLPLNEDFRLLLVDKAIADLKLKEVSLVPLLVIILGIGGIGYFAYQMMKPPPPPPPKPIIVNPYAQYEQQLASPSPENILNAVAKQVQVVSIIPGWQATNMKYANNTLDVTLTTPIQASGDFLVHWAKKNNLDLGIQSNSASVKISIDVPSRPKPTTIYNLRQILAEIFDDTHLFLPGSTVTFSSPTAQGKFSSSTVTVNFNNLASPILNLYGRVLKDKPVVLESMTFNLQGGLLSGQMKLTVLGA